MMPSSGVPKVEIPLVDKWTHFILFGGYSFLWMWRIEIKDKRSVALVIISGVVYGAVIELLQGLLVMLGRSMEFMDWVADTIGVLLGWFLYAAVMRMSGNNKSAT
jgi:VanZ family protein